MKVLITILLILHIFSAQAQWGVKAISLLPKNRITETTSQQKLFPYLLGGGVDYWFRLKNYRMEFYPSFHALQSSEQFIIDDNSQGKLRWSIYDFAPIMQLYPLDFINDCKCPTFSKQGNLLKKGWFINFAPGIAMSQLNGKGTTISKTTDYLFFGRIGTGIDIGLSDLITLSPSINYQQGTDLDWSKFFTSTTSNKVNLYSGLLMNLRLGWRMDRKNY